MDFPERLAALRNERNMIQRSLAELILDENDEKHVVKSVIESILLSHEAKRWAA